MSQKYGAEPVVSGAVRVATEPPGGVIVPAAANRKTGRLTDAARAAIDAGMPDATRRAYREDLDRYAAWAEAAGRGGGLPATATDLTEYATFLAYGDGKGQAPSTIERARWAILKWHDLAGQPKPSTAGLVTVLKGYRAHLARTKAPKAAPRKATEATGDAITAMIATLDRGTPAGQRDAAIILVGFGIAGRRGEIAGLDITDITFAPRGMQLEVYRQKTRIMDHPVLMYQPKADTCPVQAAEQWITALAAVHRANGPLFPRINRHGRIAHPVMRDGQPIGDPGGRMTGQAVADVIRRGALAAGLGGRWSGHSLRRGLATELHKAGRDRRLIERQGGWTAGSAAVSGYIEDAERWMYDVLEGVL